MIAQFALLLTFGMSLMWALMPRSQVTSGFFRIQMLLAMSLSVLAVLTLGRLVSTSGQPVSPSWILAARGAAGSVAGVAYVGSIFWLVDQRRSGTACMLLILAGSLLSLVMSRGGFLWIGGPGGPVLLASYVATAAVLGGAMTGMLLGHWYLTAPTMSIDPLKRLCLLFAIAVLLRFGVSVAGWVLAGQRLTDGTHWTWFALRWLAGIIGPLVVSVMALRILRYRNTQAATGVLFAGVILTFIGEMSAALLYSELNVPL